MMISDAVEALALLTVPGGRFGGANLQSIYYANSNCVATLQAELCLNVLRAGIALWQYYARSSGFALTEQQNVASVHAKSPLHHGPDVIVTEQLPAAAKHEFPMIQTVILRLQGKQAQKYLTRVCRCIA